MALGAKDQMPGLDPEAYIKEAVRSFYKKTGDMN